MWSAPGSPRTARPAPARSRNVLNDPRDVQHLDVHALAVVVGERYSSWSYSQPLGASLRRVTTSAQADVVALGGCPGSTTPPSSRRPPTPSPSSTPNAAYGGQVRAVGVEGSGSYGAGLTRYLRANG